jgi:hypothetical protein
MGTAAWSAYDDGYLRAYQWSGSLAAGAGLPQEATALPLGPNEIAHAHLAPVGVFGHFGEQKDYRRSFLLVGGPVGLALTGAASYAHNQSKKAEAGRAAIPKWHALGSADLVMTNQRLAITLNGQLESLWPAHPDRRHGWHPRRPVAAVEHAPAATRIRLRSRALRVRAPPGRRPAAGCSGAGGPARPGTRSGQVANIGCPRRPAKSTPRCLSAPLRDGPPRPGCRRGSPPAS